MSFLYLNTSYTLDIPSYLPCNFSELHGLQRTFSHNCRRKISESWMDGHFSLKLQLSSWYASFFFSSVLFFLFSPYSRRILSSSAPVFAICPACASHDQPRPAAATSSASSATTGAATRPTQEGTQTGSVSQQRVADATSCLGSKELNGEKLYCLLNVELSLLPQNNNGTHYDGFWL